MKEPTPKLKAFAASLATEAAYHRALAEVVDALADAPVSGALASALLALADASRAHAAAVDARHAIAFDAPPKKAKKKTAAKPPKPRTFPWAARTS